jgi:peptidoglycan/xylan/chitin deacetylase (PgdA/CDA1 family)
MIRRLEIVFAACLYYSGLVKLALWLTRRSGPRLVILCYHRAAGTYLRQHMLYLSRHYRVLHLESALQELFSQHGEAPLQKSNAHPSTLLALTFDDGYHDNYTHGFALARETQTPISVFLLPGYIERKELFWWQEPYQLLRFAQVRKATIGGRTYHLDKLRDCKRLVLEIEARLRLSPSVAEREAFLEMTRKVLALPSTTAIEDQGGVPLTWAEIREMEASGWVSFGGHTMNHPILGYLSDPTEAQYEVYECRAVLEQQLGHPVRTFAYPYGETEHIGAYGLHAVSAANFDYAVSTLHGFNTPQTEHYLLRRIVVDVNQHWLVIAAKASGLWEFFLRPCRMPVSFILKIRRRRNRNLRSFEGIRRGAGLSSTIKPGYNPARTNLPPPQILLEKEESYSSKR